MKVIVLSLFFLSSCSHLGQSEVQTSTSMIQIIELEDFVDEETLSLERTGDYEFYLRLRRDDEDDKIKKVSAKLAKVWEKEFAQDFILWSTEKKNISCESIYRLSLHGDELLVCEKDEQKSREVDAFYQKLQQEILN